MFLASNDREAMQAARFQRFMQMLPLTLAGLSQVEPGRTLTEGQMEARATSIRNAYKVARGLLLDMAK